jgi:cell division inhibitor SulA
MDVTNQSTRWGVWSPSQLNLNRSWSDEHGLNSLQILSYLLSSYRITEKSIYLRAFMVRKEGRELILRPCND